MDDTKDKSLDMAEFTSSRVARQNVLNNRYALDNIKKVVGIRCFLFEGEYRILKQDVAEFFEVTERAIENIVAKNEEELTENGYALYEGNRLETFKLTIARTGVSEVNFGYKARHLQPSVSVPS